MGYERVKIQAASKLYEMMMKHYMEAKTAEGTDKKIAWVTSGAPVELCHALDILPVYPENHGALCGAAHVSAELCATAEDSGFSRDLCSYARTDFGQIITGQSPVGGLPKPDLLLCNNNICGTVTKWFQELHRRFDVPLVFIDSPFIHDEITDPMLAYVRAMIENALQEMSDIVARKIDRDKFDAVAALSIRAAELWREILLMLRHKPTPMTLFDAFIHMAFIVVGRGTQDCIDYYELLRDEIAERVEQEVAAVPGERFRLGWDNIAIWDRLRDLSTRFGERQAALVVSSYTTSFGRMDAAADSADPLDWMAASYLGAYINSGFRIREQQMLDMVEDYSLDGFVMHSNRSCKPYSIGMYDIARSLTEKHGIPTVLIEADHNDPRQYSEEQINTRIDAFIETLESRASSAL